MRTKTQHNIKHHQPLTMTKMIRSTWSLACNWSLVVACLSLYSSLGEKFKNRYYFASAFQPAVVVPRKYYQVTASTSSVSSMTSCQHADKKRHCKSNVSTLCLLQTPKDTMSSRTADSNQADRRSFLACSAKTACCTSFFFVMTPILAAAPTDARAALATADPVGSLAADNDDNSDDLTFQLFNTDGSLREGVESEAKFRTFAVDWSRQEVASNQRLVNVNGVDQSPSSISTDSSIQQQESAEAGFSGIRVTYDLPDKWGSSGSDLYLDRNDNNLKACNRITVYQAPVATTGAVVDYRLLEKAATTGIAKALDVPSDIYSPLTSADLIGGKTRIIVTTTNEAQPQKYFDFDMALAPSVCSDNDGVNNKENLGLGFCPFESIYLISSTIVNGRVYAFVLECEKAQWKRANSDLRKVRSTFSVRSITA
jgi:hypothetical protein